MLVETFMSWTNIYFITIISRFREIIVIFYRY